MDVSVFDIIGPVMMGPSSSGTAGMYRLGSAARQFFPFEPKEIVLRFTAQYGAGYLGCRSHFGLLGGILGLEIADPQVPRVVEICKERNIPVSVSYMENTGGYHPLTVEILMTRADGKVCSMVGSSIGAGAIKLLSVNGFPIDMAPMKNYMIVWADRDPEQDLPAGAIVQNRGTDWFAYYPVRDDSALAAIRAKYPESLYFPAIVPLGSTEETPLFTTWEELITLSEETGQDVAELTIQYEVRRSGRTREAVENQMKEAWQIMRQAAARGFARTNKPLYGYNPGDNGWKLSQPRPAEKNMSGPVLNKAMATALAVMEYSMALGCIVAAPTGGSAGILPGCLMAVKEDKGLDDGAILKAMFTAAAVGVIMGHKEVSFSGAQGGCQGEVGVSAAMAAAALVCLGGGDAGAISHGMALTMKNILGLVCDPLMGCDEVPCIKRNAIGVSIAFAGADLALAGITSFIPPDEVVDALLACEKRLPVQMRGCSLENCGACGTRTGLASWETTRKLAADVILPEKP